jgi:hypothetical protein
MNVTQLIARGSDARGYTLDYKTPYAPDVERRIDQIQRLSPAQRDAVARRLLGRGGQSAPQLTSAAVWIALDALESLTSYDDNAIESVRRFIQSTVCGRGDAEALDTCNAANFFSELATVAHYEAEETARRQALAAA